MASIFKRKKGRNEPYVIQYVDHQGKRRTAKGFTDKGLTEELAANLESEARLRRTGLIDPLQDRLAEHDRLELSEHLKAFEESLKDNSPKHVTLTMSRVRRITAGCGFESLSAIEPEMVRSFLRSFRKTSDLGARTYNHYLQAFDSFCNWCVVTKRLLRNPLLGLERLNAAVDVRHARRSLSADEVAKLVDSARSSRKRIQGFSGEQRARIYLLSFMTGLRRKEIASLTPRSFALDAAPPTVTVEAACSKHRRKDVLPLHPELVGMLRIWLTGVSPAAKLFPKLELRRTWFMVKKDLERVGIAYKNADGIADFHAAGRHSHITELLRNGATLVEAKELARHSDVNMTMRYTHIGLEDQAKAVAHLPLPKCNPRPKGKPTHEPALQMRCRFCSAKSHQQAAGDNEAADQKRENPCHSKGSGVSRRQVSPPDKVEAAGIEGTAPASEALAEQSVTTIEPTVSALCLHGEGTSGHKLASTDTALHRIVELWPSLPASIRQSVYAMCVDAVLLGG